jgi:hypothetical protein
MRAYRKGDVLAWYGMVWHGVQELGIGGQYISSAILKYGCEMLINAFICTIQPSNPDPFSPAFRRSP